MKKQLKILLTVHLLFLLPSITLGEKLYLSGVSQATAGELGEYNFELPSRTFTLSLNDDPRRQLEHLNKWNKNLKQQTETNADEANKMIRDYEAAQIRNNQDITHKSTEIDNKEKALSREVEASRPTQALKSQLNSLKEDLKRLKGVKKELEEDKKIVDKKKKEIESALLATKVAEASTTEALNDITASDANGSEKPKPASSTLPSTEIQLIGDNGGKLRINPGDKRVEGYTSADGRSKFNVSGTNPDDGTLKIIDPLTGQTGTINPNAPYGTSPVSLNDIPVEGTNVPARVQKDGKGGYKPSNAEGSFATDGSKKQLVSYTDGSGKYQYAGRNSDGNALYRATNGDTKVLDINSGAISDGATFSANPTSMSVVSSNTWTQGTGALQAGYKSVASSPAASASTQILPYLFIPGWNPPNKTKGTKPYTYAH